MKGLLPAAFSQRDYDAFLDRLRERKLASSKGDLVALYDFKPEPSTGDKKQLDRITEVYRSGWFHPPSARDALEKAGAEPGRRDELLNYLVTEGNLVKITEELYFHSDAYHGALTLLRGHFAENENLTLARFRDITGSSRKYAQALLEHFDQTKLTRRVEDHRVALKLERPGKGR